MQNYLFLNRSPVDNYRRIGVSHITFTEGWYNRLCNIPTPVRCLLFHVFCHVVGSERKANRADHHQK